ncbi:MAG: hydrogenase maturation nickel metallochaperone HypA, partial [Propionibacteriaceae bacterium]|nr:hydrogenase maturation nickel metallochaperone HypA [Propionibacteriaceae bacterium]
MHELSLCRSIAQIARRAAPGRRITTVHVAVGALRQAVPSTLVHCWGLLNANGDLSGSSLEVDLIPAQLLCRACGERTTLRGLPILKCGGCQGQEVDVVAGEELLVTALDV